VDHQIIKKFSCWLHPRDQQMIPRTPASHP
jgi:hypothetical protein